MTVLLDKGSTLNLQSQSQYFPGCFNFFLNMKVKHWLFLQAVYTQILAALYKMFAAKFSARTTGVSQLSHGPIQGSDV